MPFRYDCTQWSEELTQQFSLWPVNHRRVRAPGLHPHKTALLIGDRGRSRVLTCPSLRTGRANFSHPALQSVGLFYERWPL